jgi:hypothetical protein
VSRELPTTTMRFGAFPSSDDYQSDGGSSVQQVPSWMKPSLSAASPISA